MCAPEIISVFSFLCKRRPRRPVAAARRGQFAVPGAISPPRSLFREGRCPERFLPAFRRRERDLPEGRRAWRPPAGRNGSRDLSRRSCESSCRCCRIPLPLQRRGREARGGAFPRRRGSRSEEESAWEDGGNVVRRKRKRPTGNAECPELFLRTSINLARMDGTVNHGWGASPLPALPYSGSEPEFANAEAAANAEAEKTASRRDRAVRRPRIGLVLGFPAPPRADPAPRF